MPPDRCPLSIFCSRGTQMDENALSQPTLSLSTRHTVYQESVSWYMTSIPQVMRPFCDRKGGGGLDPPSEGESKQIQMCRFWAKIKHIRQSRPDSGLNVQVKVLNTSFSPFTRKWKVKVVCAKLAVGELAAGLERRGNNRNGSMDCHLKVTAKIWPWLSHMCHILSTADWRERQCPY